MVEEGFRIFRAALRKKLCPTPSKVKQEWKKLSEGERERYAEMDRRKKEQNNKPNNLKQLLYQYNHRLINQKQLEEQIVLVNAQRAIERSMK